MQNKDPLIIFDERRALEIFQSESVIAIDTETTGLSPWQDKIAVVALNGLRSEITAVLHVRGRLSPDLIAFLSDPTRTFVGHNLIAFDLLMLANHGVNIHSATWYDTLVGEQVVNMTNRRDVRFSLQASIRRRLGVDIKKGISHGQWMNPNLSTEQLAYVAGDVKYLHELRAEQIQKAVDKDIMSGLETEMKLVPIAAQLSLNGLPLNFDRLQEHLLGESTRAIDAQDRLWDKFGPFNIASPQQCVTVLNNAGIDIPASDAQTLTDIIQAGGDPGGVLVDIMTVRRARKRTNSYDSEWVGKYTEEHDNWLWIHPRFWSLGTDTGRFSSSDPNMQQWPQNMRWVVAPPPGFRLFAGDYQQLEVVVAAAIAKDSDLLAAAASGQDIHSQVASRIYGIPVENISKEQRRNAKAGNFTFIFGGWYETFYRYARLAGGSITIEEAKQFEQSYFNAFRGLAAMKSRARSMSARGGAVSLSLPTGIRRALVPSAKTGRVASTQILNTAVQGTAAAGMKFALIDLYAKDCKLLGTGISFHDELAGTARVEDAEEISREVKLSMLEGMEKVVGVRVGVDMHVQDDWGKA